VCLGIIRLEGSVSREFGVNITAFGNSVEPKPAAPGGSLNLLCERVINFKPIVWAIVMFPIVS
jgi:hypothetical protein